MVTLDATTPVTIAGKTWQRIDMAGDSQKGFVCARGMEQGFLLIICAVAPGEALEYYQPVFDTFIHSLKLDWDKTGQFFHG